jgi:dolichol-phosphate mannosyltransferase
METKVMTTTETLALSVIVPCCNEAESLPLLMPRLHDVCRSVTSSYEILLIDDGSTDGTTALIDRIVEEYPKVLGIRLARRFGQQIALSAGLSMAKGDRILFIDADLQDPPELLPDMIRLMEEGADVVYGQRVSRAGESEFKKASAHWFYRFLRHFGDANLPLDAGDFRLISRRVADLLLRMPERQRFLRGMISWIGLKQVPILYARHERAAGKTKYPLAQMAAFAMDAITSFSAAPLRLSLFLSLATGGLSLVLMLYAVGAWLLGDTVQGWTSLTCIMLLFFGLQFLCIGLIGEYVGRLYLENKGRPLFVIDTLTKRNEEK